jgi:hypothetical protein
MEICYVVSNSSTLSSSVGGAGEAIAGGQSKVKI